MNDQALMALKVIAPAALAAGLIALAAWFPRASLRRDTQRPRSVSRLGWAAALALGAGFVSGFLVVSGGWPGWPLAERWMWLLPIAAAATAFGVSAGVAPTKALVQLVIAAALAASIGLLLQPVPGRGSVLALKAGAGIAVFVLWLTLEPLARRRPGVSLPLALWMVFAGLSMVILEARLANLSLITAAASAAAAAVGVVALIQPRLSLARGGVHVSAALLVALSVIGWMYRDRFGDVTALHFGLLLLAPAALWLGELPPVARRRPWQAALIRLALVAIPVGIAVALTLIGGDAGDEYPY